MGLPLLGVLVAQILSQMPRSQRFAWAALPVFATLTLIAAWAAHSQPFEITFGNWSPVSVVGAPLILAGSLPATTILIAVAAAQLSTSLHPREAGLQSYHTTAALLFGALTLTALSNNLLTLFIGVGLVDILAALAGVQRDRDYRRVIANAMFNGASSALLVVVLALYHSQGNSLYIPLATLPERLMPFVTVSLALRFGLAPLRAVAGQYHDTHWTSEASVVAGMIVLSKVPALGAPGYRAWFFGLALLTVALVSAFGAVTRRRSILRASISSGGMGMAVCAAVLQQPGAIAVATLGWLIGSRLVALSPRDETVAARRAAEIGRVIGALCLAGLPLTAGFIGRAGAAAIWADRGLGGAVLVLAFALAQMLFTLCALRLAFAPTSPSTYNIQLPVAGPIRMSTALSIFVVTILSLHVLVFGIVPTLAGALDLGDALSRNGLEGWAAWLIPVAAAVALWWFEARWAAFVDPLRQRVYNLFGLSWLHTILDGAMNRISLPLSRVFSILESGSALLWTIVILLIVLLVSRPGGP